MAEQKQDRLWGVPGAEDMQFEAESAYESQIDGYYDGGEDDLLDQTHYLEEWSVEAVIDSFPSAVTLREYMAEFIAERAVDGHGGEDYYEAVETAFNVPEVEQYLQMALEHAAGNITYRCADKLIATHAITYAKREDGGIDVFMDGKPFYDHPAPPTNPWRKVEVI